MARVAYSPVPDAVWTLICVESLVRSLESKDVWMNVSRFCHLPSLMYTALFFHLRQAVAHEGEHVCSAPVHMCGQVC